MHAPSLRTCYASDFSRHKFVFSRRKLHSNECLTTEMNGNDIETQAQTLDLHTILIIYFHRILYFKVLEISGSQVTLVGKNLPANAGNVGLTPGLGGSPGEGNGILLHSKEMAPVQRSLGDYSPWGRKTWT